MDNLTQELQGTADTAEAEVKGEAAADLGKFKDVQALLNAYNNLEAEFTRRSQRLRELEERSNPQAADTSATAAEGSAQMTDAELYGKAAASAAVKDRIIGDYLLSVSRSKGAPIVTGGVPVSSPKAVPATIKEAGRLAAEFLRKI